MWVNNFVEFERKQTRQNRLVLNFHCLETGRSVKAYVPQKVRIPTGFLPEYALEKLTKELSENPAVSKYPVSSSSFGRFSIAAVEMPHNLQEIHELPKGFQTGNYDKLLRFAGIYPERKADLAPELEALFASSEEVELKSLEGVQFRNEFLTEEDFYRLPSLYIDIEKPLWKKDDERPLLAEREKLLKTEKHYSVLQRKKAKGKLDEKGSAELVELNQSVEERRKRVSELEQKLTIEVKGVGKVPLYDKRFNADISFVTTIWKDPLKKTETRELYVLDPHNEIRKKTHNGYAILRFKTEEELIQALMKNLDERKPVISRGHNQVYDISQLTYAAGEYGMTFAPAVRGVKPRRDFVRQFLQRLREDMIYLDTLWIHTIMAPYLRQKSFGSSLKLASVAQHRGFDFKKSLTHEQLRYEEAKRLAGKTKEIRHKANLKMLEYATDDVDYTKGISDVLDPIFIPLLVRMKEVLPFATYSEIAFSTGCVKKSHEFRHFQRCQNLPYWGYRTKIRENEKQIFKKRFPALKKNRLEETCGFSPANGMHRRVIREYYFSLEESLIDWAFLIEPKLKPVYEWAKEQSAKSVEGREQFLGFMQYMRDFMKDPFTDYYFAKRDGRAFFHAQKFLLDSFAKTIDREPDEELAKQVESGLLEKFRQIEKSVDGRLLDKFMGSFRYLKNHFRSIYVDAEGEERGAIRPTDRRIREFQNGELFPQFADDISLPEIAREFDADLYLLRKNQKTIQKNFTPSEINTLKSFLTNFQKFDETSKAIEEIIEEKKIYARGSSLFDLLYTYLYWRRSAEDDRSFEPRYHKTVKDINARIKKSYNDLAEAISRRGTLIDYKGDYLFVAIKPGKHIDIPWLHPVRRLRKYAVGKISESEIKHPRLDL